MAEIDNLRQKINEIDSKIIELLRDRFAVAKDIGNYKKSHGLKIKDLKREKEVLNRVVEKTKEQGVKDIEEIKQIYKSIMKNCRKLQEKD